MDRRSLTAPATAERKRAHAGGQARARRGRSAAGSPPRHQRQDSGQSFKPKAPGTDEVRLTGKQVHPSDV